MRLKTKILISLAFFLFVLSVIFIYIRQTGVRNEQIVKETVTSFGQSLRNVSLFSLSASEEIEAAYSEFLDPALLGQWKENPDLALGKTDSNSWPEGIEIGGIRKVDSSSFDVFGKVIDIRDGKIIGSRAIELNLVRVGDGWWITKISIVPSSSDLWKDYDDGSISYQYPDKLIANYIFAQEWPPVIEIKEGTFSCLETPQEISSMLETTSQRLVDNRLYCVDVKNEGVAGSTYSSYVYTAPKRGKLVKISFVLRYPNCGNYEESQNQACASEREAFDLDSIIDRIFKTINWELDETSLSDQIMKCLVSSYSADQKRCTELLEEITDFDSCLMAGFSITKENTLQCQTIDGRIFLKD